MTVLELEAWLKKHRAELHVLPFEDGDATWTVSIVAGVDDTVEEEEHGEGASLEEAISDAMKAWRYEDGTR